METVVKVKETHKFPGQGAASEIKFSSINKGALSNTINFVSGDIFIESLSHINPGKKDTVRSKLLQPAKFVEEYKGGNETTLNLYKLGFVLSILTGLVSWYRYESVFAFLIITTIYILSNIVLNKIPSIKIRNILLGSVSVVLFLSIFIPV